MIVDALLKLLDNHIVANSVHCSFMFAIKILVKFKTICIQILIQNVIIHLLVHDSIYKMKLTHTGGEHVSPRPLHCVTPCFKVDRKFLGFSTSFTTIYIRTLPSEPNKLNILLAQIN